MRDKLKLMIAVAMTLIFCAQSSLAQGSLMPPGAPGATMKSLDQIEPRIPISSVPITLMTPGSYYLTTNLTAGAGQNGISVWAHDVTIDLNGFTLSGSGTDSGTGVSQSSSSAWNLRIFNGKLINWAGESRSAVRWGGENFRAENLSVSDNDYGLFIMAPGSQIINCKASGNKTYGIYGGMGSLIENCIVINGVGHGVFGQDKSIISGCNVYSNGVNGITTGNEVTVRNCNVAYSEGDNISVNNGCVVENNLCRSAGSSGIRVRGDRCRIDSNMVMNNQRGIIVDGKYNLVTRNNAGNNTINYYIVVSNKVGTIISPLDCTPISGDTGGGLGSVAAYRPWVNFVTDTNGQ